MPKCVAGHVSTNLATHAAGYDMESYRNRLVMSMETCRCMVVDLRLRVRSLRLSLGSKAFVEAGSFRLDAPRTQESPKHIWISSAAL